MHMQHTSPASESTVITSRARMKSILSASAGNLVEWYDFFIYAYTAIYFAHHFFPQDDPTSQLLATAGIFAVGFFMRPLGGWLFGKFADRKGRRRAMLVSIFMMCGGSLMIAVLPDFSSIGVAAPALLLLARLIQGLSVGAEYGTGAAYISEISSKGRRAFWGSFQYSTIIAGQLIALLTITLLQQILTSAQMEDWGWRIPFALGAVSALVVLYIRRGMLETLDTRQKDNKQAGSVRELLKYKKAIVITLFLTMGCSLYFYVFTSYMQKYLVLSAGFPKETVSLIMTSALIIFMLMQPVFGMLADKIGTRTTMMLFGTLAATGIFPIMAGLGHVTTPFSAFLLVTGGLLIACLYTPVTGVLKADIFPAEIRALGISLPYAIGNALCGGTAGYLALLSRTLNAEHYFFMYVAVMAVLTMLAAWALPDLRRHGYLDGDGQVEEMSHLLPGRKTWTSQQTGS